MLELEDDDGRVEGVRSEDKVWWWVWIDGSGGAVRLAAALPSSASTCMVEDSLLRAAMGVAVGCDGVREHGASDMLVADLVLRSSISLTYKSTRACSRRGKNEMNNGQVASASEGADDGDFFVFASFLPSNLSLLS